MKTIYFRADGNSRIGLGHVTRCLALADMLAEYFLCTFLVQNPTDELAAQISENHGLICLPQSDGFLAEAMELSQKYFSADTIVILDGYEFCTEYQRTVKESGTKLVCIDDLHIWHFAADVVINHAGGVAESRYSREAYTRLCLGPSYALLRAPFLRAAQQRQPPVSSGGLFICFGGADPQNLTYRAVRLAAKSNWIKKIIAVVGSGIANGEAMQSLQYDVDKLELHSNVDAHTMISLMRQCELAIAPASGISYEIASVGMRFITGYYVDNQKYLYQFLTENRLAHHADRFQTENLQKLLSVQPAHNLDQLNQQEKWFSGKSSQQLLGVFIGLAMQSRSATTDDVKTYFGWANDPQTRRNSFNADAITWQQHKDWFVRCISDPNFTLYLFYVNGIPVGQVRFELVEDTATISVSIDSQFRGMGLASKIISQAIGRLAEEGRTRIVKGVVKNDNTVSLAMLVKIGFEIVEKGDYITNFELVL